MSVEDVDFCVAGEIKSGAGAFTGAGSTFLCVLSAGTFAGVDFT